MGNAYVDGDINDKATYDYLWTHALIAHETYNNIQSNCNFSSSDSNADCDEAITSAQNVVGKIDMYDIYAPLCSRSSNIKASVQPDPCADDYVDNYLNLADVQKALHATVHLPYPWTACSGDQDSVVPMTSTRYLIKMLKLSVESEWMPWYTNDQVRGYVIGYKGLTLATVRRAGHSAKLSARKSINYVLIFS